MSDKVLVTGATGNTGGSAVRSLLKMNVPVRAMVHHINERSEALVKMGAEVIKGDLSNLGEVSEAMKGVSSAFFVYPILRPGIIEATALFCQAGLFSPYYNGRYRSGGSGIVGRSKAARWKKLRPFWPQKS